MLTTGCECSTVSFLGMGMVPTGPMGGRGGGYTQGHFNPAFMQGGQAQGGGQFVGPDGPRKRHRTDESAN